MMKKFIAMAAISLLSFGAYAHDSAKMQDTGMPKMDSTKKTCFLIKEGKMMSKKMETAR